MTQAAFDATVGQTVSCTKTVGESDVYLFAGITGDLSDNHVNEDAMAKTPYGHRIAHGALLVGYMSRASTVIQDKCPDLMATHFPVSLGYDRVRFIKAVLIGDTITAAYTITGTEPAKSRTTADVQVTNQRGEICAVATHIMQWIARG
ncbi:MAG TPA: MaoC/PaaZ C-terminal domain-containing protein [Aestuariivirga sp.]|nr:dehydratase [Alphaproteobacteria bacterium]HRX37409.1 MaoC/PaaZ C-terminal domain-containing protein [Aestuariivirga sp.]